MAFLTPDSLTGKFVGDLQVFERESIALALD
jgi:hypothetical protein